VPPPKYYADACTNHPLGKEYGDYEKLEVLFGPQDDFDFTNKLGRGRYSEVFRGVDLINNADVVIKILKPVKKIKVRREIQILDIVKGGPYIINLNDKVMDPSNKTPSLVFEYVENTDFRELYPKLEL
jgi:casein kinase II subunit alpha